MSQPLSSAEMAVNEFDAARLAGTGRCPDCGAAGVGGREGCQALFDQLTLRAYDDYRYAAVQTLAFDTYCMQHLERYCRSAKSYAAHLTRLCCGLEHGGNPQVYAAIQRWLSGAVSIDKPPLLDLVGAMTVADLQTAQNAQEYDQLVGAWAECVWDAYASQQTLARSWIEAALKAADRTAKRPDSRGG